MNVVWRHTGVSVILAQWYKCLDLSSFLKTANWTECGHNGERSEAVGTTVGTFFNSV